MQWQIHDDHRLPDVHPTILFLFDISRWLDGGYTKFKVHINRLYIFVRGAEGTANDIVASEWAQMAYFMIR